MFYLSWGQLDIHVNLYSVAKDRCHSFIAEESFHSRIDRKLVPRPLEKQQGNNGTDGKNERTILVKLVTYVMRARAPRATLDIFYAVTRERCVV